MLLRNEAMRTFSHFGIQSREPNENEVYMELLHMYRTAPECNSHRVELMRFEEDPSPVLPEAVRTSPHVAYTVDDLESEMKGGEVLFGPFRTAPTRRIAFVREEGIVVELVENK